MSAAAPAPCSLSYFSSSRMLGLRISLPSTTPIARVALSRPVAAFPCAKIAKSATLYEVLGLSYGATCQEIKSAYRRLARSCHPDVVASDRKGESADEFMKIHAAYSTLSDPEKRAPYDRRIWRSRQPCPSAISVNSNRKWETDQCW